MLRMRAYCIFLMWMAGLLFLVGPACTDADIFETPGLGKGQQDNKMRVKGGFCTEHPDELKFPVKIMFIIDCSQSMIVTDPPPSPNEYPGRVGAVWEVIQKFRHDPGVEFAMLRFEAAANVATQRDTNGDGIADMFGFVNDLAALLRALNSLVAAGGNTSYQAALGLAEATLAMDMSQSSVDERARTKYVVIFLSDGLPYPMDFDDEVNTPDSIRRALTEMMNLPKRFDVNDFTFHTAYLSVNTPDYVKQQAEDLLKSMANIGGGTYRNFENGEEINFLDIDYTSIKRMYSLKDGAFMVSNTNAHPAWTKSESIDTDGDGLVDLLEQEIGTSIGMIDTDGDGFNDLLEYKLRRSGFDPLDPDDADCSLALDRLDRDGDGLLDCEERFIGTSPDLFDTDADGVPDPVEFRSGTNPVWGDSDVDMDFDGSRNGNEVAWHTNPTQNDAAQFSKLAYRYSLQKLAGVFESRLCYEFKVENITLVGTPERSPGEPAGFNDIMVYAGQVPQDDPDDYGTFRVACARVRYIPRYPEPDIKYPPSGLVKFKQSDFKRPVATLCGSDEECPHHVCDPYKHVCLAPFGDVCDELTPCPHFTCQKAFGAAASDPGTCESPVMVACLGADDCPPYPIDEATNTCMDPNHLPPDAITNLCPRRECIPVYVTCDQATPCQPDSDTNPDNDPLCLNGFCRVPCFDAGDCNPGETCDPDDAGEYIACQINADCPVAGMECLEEACRIPCVVAADCPTATDTCDLETIGGIQQRQLCAGHHCVDHHGGSCLGVECTADDQCPFQPCDDELGRCLTQPCLDSRECEHQRCEPVLGFCVGTQCEGDEECRGDRGYTCNEIVGDPCDRDIDCPYDFCNTEILQCFFGGAACQANGDCSGQPNLCQNIDPNTGSGTCSQDSVPCGSDLDCQPNYCRSFFVCENDAAKGCVTSLDCPQTFCGTDNRCVNNGANCAPATENIDNACQVGMCARAGGLGICDTVEHEECATSDDCPNYRCNLSLNLCYYPVDVACQSAAVCPETGMECDATGFCIKRCNSDADCPRTRCQGRCVPMDPDHWMRCTDWFDAERDCQVFGDVDTSGP